MSRKILVTFCVITIYVVLIGIFVKTVKETSDCKNSVICIRFCSEDTENYSNEFLLEEFKKSAKELKKMDVKIYRGSPMCGGMIFLRPNENITSDQTSYEICSVSIFINYI